MRELRPPQYFAADMYSTPTVQSQRVSLAEAGEGTSPAL